MIGAYASAVVISLASMSLGRGITVLAGYAGSNWLSASVGFAGLMIVCDVAINLPGHAWTAVAAVVVVCALSVWLAARRGSAWPAPTDGVVVFAVVLAVISVPFVASARVGVLGISFLNDTHWHLFLAEELRRPALKPLEIYGLGYPLGPHSVATTFAQALGTGVDKTLTGMLMAVPLLTGLAALEALRDIGRPQRWLVAVLTAIPYLAAAAYAESAFKEPIMSLLIVGILLALQGARRTASPPRALMIPIAVLVAGVLYDYSYPGLLWPVAIIGCWLVAELLRPGVWRVAFTPVSRGTRRETVRETLAPTLRRWSLAVGAGALLLVVLVAPDLAQIHRFWVANGGSAAGTVGGVVKASLANLVGPLSILEGLNVWLTGDFRLHPSNELHAGALAGFALVAFVFAIASALERRERAWPATMLGLLLAYLYVRHTQSPYIAAKALTIPAPVVALGTAGELFRRLSGVRLTSFFGLGLAAAITVLLLASFDSSGLVLRDALVGPTNHWNELRGLRAVVHDRPTLMLVNDDYFKWELLGVPVSSPLNESPIPVAVQPGKPFSYGQALDFDSVDAATLDRFDYVITTRTDAQSTPPPNFHVIAISPSYEVWRRDGPTPAHMVLLESGQPGAILDCHTPIGRRIAHERGFAVVRPQPLYFNVGSLLAGQSERLVLKLPPGVWQLSLPFVAVQPVTVSGAGLDSRLPPNLDRPGNIWPVGTVQSTGSPLVLTIKMANQGPISATTPVIQGFAPQQMVAVPPVPPTKVPLRDACGRYVDWYQLT